MKFICLFAILFLSLNTIFAQEKSTCNQGIRNGTFISNDPGYEDYSIKRKGNKQIEYIKNQRSRIYSDVNWIDDNTFEITVTRIVRPTKNMKDAEKHYVFKVINCEGDFHTLQAIYKGQKMTFEMEKIK